MLPRVSRLLEAGELEQAEGLVHALKGVAGNVGARAVFEAAKELEALLKAGQLGESRDKLERLRESLEPLLAALAALEPEQSGQPAAGQPLAGSELRDWLQCMTSLLEGKDMEALELLAGVGRRLDGPEAQRLAGAIQADLARHDFTSARRWLEQLGNHLGLV